MTNVDRGFWMVMALGAVLTLATWTLYGSEVTAWMSALSTEDSQTILIGILAFALILNRHDSGE